MCGIAGYFLPQVEARPAADMLSMCRLMQHRGPDDEGAVFIAVNAQDGLGMKQHSLRHAIDPNERPVHDLALGHRRFSIIAPTPEGHQPFWSEDRKLCLTFNGEIYNYIELRSELRNAGITLRTSTDTEVLLEAYRHWGTDVFQKLRGFWALAIYDADRSAILLARDPLGKAPLYVAPMSSGVAWASEIKSLRVVALEAALAPREHAISDFLYHGWRDLDNRTFYEDVWTLAAGSYAWVRSGALSESVSYWQIPTHRATETDIPADLAIRNFRDAFLQAVDRRLRADVPLSFELSGGMDSSSIVAAALEMGHNVTTFTVKFREAHSDEEPFARKLKERFGKRIDYRVLQEPMNSFWREANNYVALMDEPFHAPNMLTNFAMWREMAKSGIRVSLNGAAGDELLAGYSRDYAFRNILHLFRHRQIGSALRELVLYQELPHGRLLAREALDAFRRRLRSPNQRAPLAPSPTKLSRRSQPRNDLEGRLVDLMGNWRMNYWLRSGHQSAMGVPMEVRAPFLDIDIVNLVFQLPPSYLIRDGWHKWILRKAMAGVLPPEITWRKRKMGFPFPIREWLAQSKNLYFSVVGGMECPHIDMKNLRRRYDELARSDPYFLWRTMSISLWWKRSVLAEEFE